jgi:hypothetical protein
MARSYDYAVVKVSPDPIRDEALNVAVAVLRPDRLDVCLTPNPERLRGGPFGGSGFETGASASIDLTVLTLQIEAVDDPGTIAFGLGVARK